VASKAEPQRPASSRTNSRIAVALTVALAIFGLRFCWPYYCTWQAVRAAERAGARVGITPGGPACLDRVAGPGLRVLLGTPRSLEAQSATVPFAIVEHFPLLEHVDFSSRPVTDSDLIHLRHLRRLRSLQLSNTAITGSGLVHLRAAARLESLNLDGTPLTAAGLRELQTLTSLRELSLSNTGVSEAAIDALRQVVPEVMISDD
jgi:hypothetical protein